MTLHPENNVQTLLYDHDCVIIPSFGGFIKRDNPTVIDKFSHSIKPKGATVFFNGALQQNDGLLANHIVAEKNISYQDALSLLVQWVENTEKEISLTGKFKFGNLGTFFVNAEGKKWFSPNSKLNFSKDTFGLEAIVAKTIIETVDNSKEVEAQAKLDKQTTKPVFIVTRKKKGLAKGMKIAASFVILAGVGTALFFSFFSNNPIFPFEQAHIMSIEDSTPLVDAEIKNSIKEDEFIYVEEEGHIKADTFKEQESWTFEDSKINVVIEVPENEGVQNPIQYADNDVNENVSTDGIYTILAGAFLHESNAQRRIELLSKNGFELYPVKPEDSRLTRIQCGKFFSEKEAESMLNKVKEIIPEAHITSFK